MKKAIVILLLCSFSFAALPILKKIKSANTIAIDVDGAGSVYFIDNNLNLCLSATKADSIKKFSIANYGSSAMIDASNQLEIFVFFNTTGHVVIFDNQLNVQQDISIFSKNNLDPAAFGRANDGNIWILDKNTQTLKKFSRNGVLIFETVILENYASEPNIVRRIYDNGENIILNDQMGKLYYFNQNLYLHTYLHKPGEIVGQQGSDCFIQNNNYVVRFSISETKPNKSDTLFANFHGKSVRVNEGFLLESDDSCLILHEKQ